LQWLEAGQFERLHKQSRVQLAVVLKRGVAGVSLPVTHAVENAHGVAQHAAVNVAVQLKTEIAAWYQVRGQRTLVEEHERIRLQILQTDRRLEFAASNCNAGE